MRRQISTERPHNKFCRRLPLLRTKTTALKQELFKKSTKGLDSLITMPNPPDLRTAASQIQATAHIIQDEMQRVPELRKRFSVNHRKLFSIDLALVAHNIRYVKNEFLHFDFNCPWSDIITGCTITINRTGCLLDLVAPENAVQDFSILLGSLRAVSVVHIL